ncbi:MAG TPA: tRNA (adenosine(37)-N6)-dimethylallyltransferase MiaA [Burkholderiales bacterium]|nr:tRNA (adenosine(37)-N6)-dimethylallyltransferase MiaA [Burkholderiales bacterium]
MAAKALAPLRNAAYALLGPTASGKSQMAMALAERVPLEIVSMDSVQVYRGLDIGTAKPSAAERSRVPHHLIDVIDPDQSYSTGRWRTDAIRCVGEILSRGNVPLIVGGTMLYYRALVGGLDALPQADPEIRAAINAEARDKGWASLHAELAKVDPAAARRIPVRDAQRIQRALEVWRLTGKPMSSLQGGSSAGLPFALKAFALMPPEREALAERIAARFDAMLAAGLVDEVRRLRSRYKLSAALPSMRAVGYRQVWQNLEGEIDAGAMRNQAVAATRQLAKRQLTWLRSFRELEPAEKLVHSFL